MADDTIEIEIELNGSDFANFVHKQQKITRYGYLWQFLALPLIFSISIIFQYSWHYSLILFGYSSEFIENLDSIKLIISLVIVLLGGFYIFYTSFTAYIVPKRAFKTEEQYQIFYQKCVEYHKAAQGEAVDA